MSHLKKFLLFFLALLLAGCGDTQGKMYAPEAQKKEYAIYKVGIHPYLNSTKMYQSYGPILDYIENSLENVQFVLETSSNYAEYEKKLFAQEFDFSLPNPYQTIHAIKHGYRVIAKMKPDTTFRGIFIARKDAHIKEVSQLKGKSVSFPAPTALAASMMPLYYLHQHGIDTHKDIQKKFVGSQYSSILNVYSKDTLVGATWPPPWESWKKENPLQAQELEIVWETKPLINNSFIAKEHLQQAFVTKVQQLLLDLDTNPSGRLLLENAGFEGFVKAKDEDYSVVNDFLQRYNEAIGNTQ